MSQWTSLVASCQQRCSYRHTLQHADEHDHRRSCSRARRNRDVCITCKCPLSSKLLLSIDPRQYLNRKALQQKPTAHISYHEGLRLIRAFLDYASHHTVEEIQAFTSQWVPNPLWVKVDQVPITSEAITKAADALIGQLGKEGIEKIGGSNWWQWRHQDSELTAEWIEMRGDYVERTRKVEKGRRVMLYIHGGAYFFGSVDEHRYQMQRHARKLRARVFAPRYRLAPQFPFPCGLHDCLAAYLYLLTVQEPEEIILAGDSAGGGMVVSILVVLRDQGLPLPAGAVLISPWVDLTHSFPSVANGSDLDYIPARGFMQKPSPAWPPPNEDEMKQIAPRRHPRERPSSHATRKGQGNAEAEAVQGFEVRRQGEVDAKTLKESTMEPDSKVSASDIVSGAGPNPTIEIDGEQIILKYQIQLYTTNQLISHPLVSPILQPSLGGLPPLLILTGGGEVLRDEQIYLAHKAANPAKYALHGEYRAQYDPTDEILNRYKPTDVQVQVWDDLCHVAPTLSFTRPAKFMYRSIAQFGAWSLARAQRRSIEITDDDDVSIISSGSDTDSSSAPDVEKQHLHNTEATSRVGKAGDSLPPFKNHMIRQRVNGHGVIYPMAPASDLPALQMPAAHVGVVKPGPVRKWLAARKQWDTRYALEKRRVQKKRMHEIVEGRYELCAEGERPPPSALVGRRRKGESGEERKKQKKSWGMSLWSLWGSKHDESTIRREEEMVDAEKRDGQDVDGAVANGDLDTKDDGTKSARRRARSTGSRPVPRRKSIAIKSSTEAGVEANLVRSRSRTRTVTVSDQGQTDGDLVALRLEYQASAPYLTTDRGRATSNPSSTTASFLSPTHILKSTKPLNPLHPLLDPNTDTPSISTTGLGTLDTTSLRNASSTAIFSAAGVIRAGRGVEFESESESANRPTRQGGEGGEDVMAPFPSRIQHKGMAHSSNLTTGTTGPTRSCPDTPLSTSSKERLWSSNHPQPLDGSSQAEEGESWDSRNPSVVAMVGGEGVVGVVR